MWIRLLLMSLLLATATVAEDPPLAAATPVAMAARRAVLQEQLQTLLQQQAQLAQQQAQLSVTIERLRGAIGVLNEYAPPDPPTTPQH